MSYEELSKLAMVLGKDMARILKRNHVKAQWPFTVTEMGFFVGNFVIPDLWSQLKEIRSKLDIPKIAKMFKKPSRIGNYYMIIPWVENSFTKKELRELSQTLFDCIKSMRKGDVYCSNGKNIIFTNEEINKMKKLNNWKKELETLKKINGSLSLYLEILYPGLMSIGHEFHGPYEVDEEKYVVREYYDLNPEFLNTEFPFQKITIYEKISKEPFFDFTNHVITNEEVTEFRIECDDKGVGNVDAFLKNLLSSIEKVSLSFYEYKKSDWLKHSLKGFYHSFSEIGKYLGKELKPGKEAYDFIKKNVCPVTEEQMIEYASMDEKEIAKKSYEGFMKQLGLK